MAAPPAAPPEWLAPALMAWADRGLGARLAALYQRLPPTTCARQGYCCGLLPPLAPVEMLAWLAGESQAVLVERSAHLADLVEHFLMNAAQRRPCPWAAPGACARYEGRFLACRAYGLWSPQAYAQRRQEALEASRAVARAWAGLGVELPTEVLEAGPGYCRHVRLCSDGEKIPRGDLALSGLEEELAQMAQELDCANELIGLGGDLSYLAARLALGPQACLVAKVRMTRDLLAGRETEAQELLARCREQARAWALAWPGVAP